MARSVLESSIFNRSLVRCYRRWDNQAPAVNKTLSGMDASPEQLVAEFLSEYQLSRTYLRDRISRLAVLAASEDPDVAESATRALFASLIERLADSFDPQGVSLYNRVFSQLTQIWRLDAGARLFDSELTKLGLVGEEDLVARAERLRHVSRLAVPRDWAEALQCVLVLSRVTLGADVAITSVILERIKHIFPAAEIVLLGGSKSVELFGGDPRLRLKEIGYRRGGTTTERLLAWTELLDCVRTITNGMRRGEYLLVDPDTRLTQLGLLPLTATDDWLDPQLRSGSKKKPEYIFFPSREYGSGTSLSLAELTCAWLDDVFGESAPTYPRVSLSQTDIESARKLASALRGGAARRIVAINFGIGDNQLKRVGGDFEASIVAHLVKEGSAVVFDKGAGDEEARRANSVIAEVTSIGRDDRRARVIEIGAHNLMDVLSSEDLGADILVWNGRIGMLAALIGESDLYIGYDSAGQHIAAALGVPCVDVFAGSNSPRMLDRWRPTGRAETLVIAVDELSGDAKADIVARVIRHARTVKTEGAQRTEET
jgi:ADP-heptose:LPS heptosyltransferase